MNRKVIVLLVFSVCIQAITEGSQHDRRTMGIYRIWVGVDCDGGSLVANTQILKDV
ncbi:hypothetical protein [Enterovibrio norvegicus]|uniref:hypothetical protein n=1 Tax=Enterovibrio norvegicus TaxID=188144 RepID=UPI0018E49CB6|nr:hypothetical protein [Enterovibrio norvegicus]